MPLLVRSTNVMSCVLSSVRIRMILILARKGLILEQLAEHLVSVHSPNKKETRLRVSALDVSLSPDSTTEKQDDGCSTVQGIEK